MLNRVFSGLVIFASLVLTGCESNEPQQDNFVVAEEWITQHKYPSQPNSETFSQQLFTLTPNGASLESKVFFILGNEGNTTREQLIYIYKAYGSPEDVIFMTAEHRGYGESITEGSQDIPDYVSAANAMIDFNRVIKEKRQTYTGKWIISGYSYGGALAIKYAHQYPDSYDVALASSAPIEWPQYIYEYALKTQENLGESLSERLSEHLQNLKTKQQDIEAQQHSELITTVIVGLSQMEAMQSIKPIVSALSYLPTGSFTSALNSLLPDAAYHWVNGQIDSNAPLGATERNWYTWKYQQCNELGTFFVGQPFSNNEKTYDERCKASFNFTPKPINSKNWQLEKMVNEIKKPLVVISGGKDPWINVGIKPDHTFDNIRYIYNKDWFHCPDLANKEAGLQVFSALNQALKESS